MSTHAGRPADLVDHATARLLQAARAQAAVQEPDPADLARLMLAVERALDALFAINGNTGGQLAHRGPDLDPTMNHGQTLDRHLRLARQATHDLAQELTRLDALPDKRTDPDDD